MGDEMVSADEAREMIEKIRAAEGAVDLTADESAALRVVERLARTVIALSAALARAEEMREAVKAEIHAAFHYNDPPGDVERPIAPRAGEWESHQTLRRLLSRVCVVLTEGGTS